MSQRHLRETMLSSRSPRLLPVALVWYAVGVQGR